MYVTFRFYEPNVRKYDIEDYENDFQHIFVITVTNTKDKTFI